MAGVNVKMGVSGVSQFKKDISAIKQSIKTMDTSLDLIEKQFKASGDAEAYMAEKSEMLQAKLEAQKSVLDSAEQALEAMKSNGVDPSTKAFQEMQREVLNAKSGILVTQTELENAGISAEGLDGKLDNIGENVSWQNVTEGIGKITDALERGAKAAVNFGKKIVRSAMDSTEWADDVLNQATKYDTDAETIQKMRNVAEFIDTEADTILTARQKLLTGIGKSSDSTMDTLKMLGVTYDGDGEQAFWDAGEALMKLGDEAKQDAAATALFGKSWRELVPLFKAGREEYDRLMEQQNVLTNEQVAGLGQADDAIKSIQQQIELMKNQFWAENADAITGLLQWLVDNKETVVTAVAAIGAAFGAMKIGEFALELGKVVDGFKTLWGGAGNKLPNLTGSGGGDTGTGGTGAGAGVPKISMAALGGAMGMAAIGASFAWALDRRRNHAEEVRGTEENLEARTAGVEQLLADYINAQKADTENLDFDRAEELYARVQETYDKLMAAEGGADALKAYSDWRQENSLGSMYWELPETLSRMETNASDLLGEASDEISNAGKEITEAADTMKRLPQETASAVANAMSGISISVNAGAIMSGAASYLAGQVARFTIP